MLQILSYLSIRRSRHHTEPWLLYIDFPSSLLSPIALKYLTHFKNLLHCAFIVIPSMKVLGLLAALHWLTSNGKPAVEEIEMHFLKT